MVNLKLHRLGNGLSLSDKPRTLIEIQHTLISSDVVSKTFHCNISACKGACCVDGEAGAPLEEKETSILRDIFPKVKPYLRPEGIAAIEAQGTFVKGQDGEWETPLVDNKECAYVVFNDENVALCGIELAYNEGAVNWQKPISCHLYPVRIKDYRLLTAVNYHKWQVCDPACALGEEMQMPLYKFVKDALIRKFGKSWYAELEEAAAEI